MLVDIQLAPAPNGTREDARRWVVRQLGVRVACRAGDTTPSSVTPVASTWNTPSRSEPAWQRDGVGRVGEVAAHHAPVGAASATGWSASFGELPASDPRCRVPPLPARAGGVQVAPVAIRNVRHLAGRERKLVRA